MNSGAIVRRVSLILCMSVAASVLAQAPNTSLTSALQRLPGMLDDHSFSALAFSQMLDKQISSSPDQVRGAVPLLQRYLQSPDVELRRNALLATFALAQRPDSATELSPLLPSLYGHLSEQDIHLREGTLISIATLQPQPPTKAFTVIADALQSTNPSDGFGTALASSLATLQPTSETTRKAVFSYLQRADVTDNVRADVLEAIASPRLGDSLTQQIVTSAREAPSGRLRNSAINACAKIGPRAVSQITTVLDAIQASSTEAPDARAAASRARATLSSR